MPRLLRVFARVAAGTMLLMSTGCATLTGSSTQTIDVITVDSAASLRAALHPADVPYLYYVLTDTSGKHAFAATYAEHQANIADARRRGVLK